MKGTPGIIGFHKQINDSAVESSDLINSGITVLLKTTKKYSRSCVFKFHLTRTTRPQFNVHSVSGIVVTKFLLFMFSLFFFFCVCVCVFLLHVDI